MRQPPARTASAGATGSSPTTWLVEQYWPGITPDGFRDAAATMAHGGSCIRYRHATMVPADEVALCVLDAASQELVEQLCARAGIRVDRIVAALDV